MESVPDIASQESALLELVAEDRDRRLQAIAHEVCTRSHTIGSEAFAAARERIREAFAEERARQEEALLLADARLASRRRQSAQRLAKLLLEQAWTDLPEAMLARWQRPADRLTWTQAVLGQAREMLPAGRWRIEVPADWPRGEREAFARAVREVTGEAPDVVTTDAVRAGVRLTTAGNCVDGTLDGLLADREPIAARLLHFLGGIRR